MPATRRRYTTRKRYTGRTTSAYTRPTYKRRAPARRTYTKRSSSTLSKIASTVGKPLVSGAMGTIGRAAGATLAGLPGAIAGGFIGDTLLPKLGQWTTNALSSVGDLGRSIIAKFGDYEIKQNSFLGKGPADMPDIVNPDPGGGFLIRRHEYLGDVISGTAGTFNVNNYFINPGQASTFPWLSQIAQNFEEWVCEGMYFEFRTMSSDALNSTNTALGQVIMAANYNATNANFTTKQAMENYEGGMSCKPSVNMMYFVECARNQTVLDDLYVRPGPVPAGNDQRFYDLANFQIATNGLQASNVNLGELWVCYQISLRKPKMFSAFGFGNLFHDNLRGSCSSAVPLGTSSALNSNVVNIPIVYTGTTMVFPISAVGQAFIGFWKWSNSAVTSVMPTITFGAGATSFAIASTPNDGIAGIKEETLIYTFYFPGNSSVADRTITFGVAGTISVSQCRININQCTNAFDGFPE